jgi:uncharacterized protein (DUF1697 family)
MTVYIALLRAVNVGGTGTLPMAKFKAMLADAGFHNVETYIASGNAVFESKASEASVKAAIEKSLTKYAGKPVGVLVRAASELRAVLKANPYPKAQTKFTTAIFLDEAPPRGALDEATGIKDEEMQRGKREIYVHYPSGMGRSKLKIPAATSGTSRNMNTVAALVKMADARDS